MIKRSIIRFEFDLIWFVLSHKDILIHMKLLITKKKKNRKKKYSLIKDVIQTYQVKDKFLYIFFTFRFEIEDWSTKNNNLSNIFFNFQLKKLDQLIRPKFYHAPICLRCFELRGFAHLIEVGYFVLLQNYASSILFLSY